MRSITFNYIIAIFAVCLLSTGCKKWLDVRPSTEVREKDLFEDRQGFADALTGVYTDMSRPNLYGKNLTMGMLDIMSQVYTLPTNHNEYQLVLYNYEDGRNSSKITTIWLAMYNAIVNANNIAHQADLKKDILTAQDYALLKGEAIGLRAFMHFDLLRMYAPSYASDPNKLSIPYIRQVSLKVTPQSTVTAALDSIIADLNEAAALLQTYTVIDDFNASGFIPQNNPLLSYRKNHFNYYAAKALLARVYLYRQDKANALSNALEVINSNKFAFVKSANLTTTGNAKDRSLLAEQIFSLHVFDLKKAADSLFKGEYYNGLGVTDAGLNVIFETASSSTDIRRNNLWEKISTNWYPTKLWQEDAISVGYKQLMPLIRLPEMYYIAAEAAADPEQGRGYLNTVRTNRGIAVIPAPVTADQLQLEIFKEYRKDMTGEGQLFFYYKRKNLNKIEGTDKVADNSIYVFPIPDNEILFGQRK